MIERALNMGKQHVDKETLNTCLLHMSQGLYKFTH